MGVKNKELLLHSITVTAKSISTEKFNVLGRAYRDCYKRQGYTVHHMMHQALNANMACLNP